jgi:hypothetical protein
MDPGQGGPWLDQYRSWLTWPATRPAFVPGQQGSQWHHHRFLVRVDHGNTNCSSWPVWPVMYHWQILAGKTVDETTGGSLLARPLTRPLADPGQCTGSSALLERLCISFYLERIKQYLHMINTRFFVRALVFLTLWPILMRMYTYFTPILR